MISVSSYDRIDALIKFGAFFVTWRVDILEGLIWDRFRSKLGLWKCHVVVDDFVLGFRRQFYVLDKSVSE